MSPISPTPQLVEDGQENSGTRSPARRRPVIGWWRCKRNAAARGRCLPRTWAPAAAGSRSRTTPAENRRNTQDATAHDESTAYQPPELQHDQPPAAESLHTISSVYGALNRPDHARLRRDAGHTSI